MTARASNQTNGTVDRCPCRWNYSSEDGNLQYTSAEISNGETVTIEGKYIVGLDNQNANDGVLIYIHTATTNETASREERSTLAILVCCGLPSEFIAKYNISEQSLCRQLKQASHCGDLQKHPVHVVVSTKSGHGYAEAVFDHLLDPLLAYFISDRDAGMKVHRTTSRSSISELSRDVFVPMARQGVRVDIILLSGDGGIFDLLNVPPLNETQDFTDFAAFRLALLPLGSGNALANSSGINEDSTIGLSTLCRGTPKDLPVFQASFSSAKKLNDLGKPLSDFSSQAFRRVFGAVVFSWGFHAALVADSDTPEYRKHGPQRFQMAGKDLLFPPDGSDMHTYKGQLRIFDNAGLVRAAPSLEPLGKDEHIYAVATYVSNLEATFRVSPASKPLDKQLRIVHFGPLLGGGKHVMELMTAAYDGGGHVKDPEVDYREISGLAVDFSDNESRRRRVCIDGTIFEVEKGSSVILQPLTSDQNILIRLYAP